MARSTTKELTSGSPMKLILGFAVPLLFGMLFQQFYSLMDTIIVGRYLGVTALAAVGATGSINFLIIGFCQESATVSVCRLPNGSVRATMTACANMSVIPPFCRFSSAVFSRH